MREYTVYISQRSIDSTDYVSELIEPEVLDFERTLKASGYTVIKKWFEKRDGYDTVEITGVK